MFLTLTAGLQRVNVVVSAVYRLDVCFNTGSVLAATITGERKVRSESFVH
jgi:hypothetical protein